MKPTDDFLRQTQYDRAKKRVGEIRSFYYNLMCYCIVIPILIYVNLTYSAHFHWFWFSACGWGVGLLCHGLGAFGYIPFLSKDWEDKKIHDFIEKDKQRRDNLAKYQ